MIDDLTDEAVHHLEEDGLEPCLIIETSRRNFQAWIQLADVGSVPYSVMGMAARHLSQVYYADQRAVSPRQPGRVPGFTNRKPKHQLESGQFPFVSIRLSAPGRTASSGLALLNRLSAMDTAGAAAGAAAVPSTNVNRAILARLDEIQAMQRERIKRELTEGRRPVHAASQSEVDFAVVAKALEEGFSADKISAWLAFRRPEKSATYPELTIMAACELGRG